MKVLPTVFVAVSWFFAGVTVALSASDPRQRIEAAYDQTEECLDLVDQTLAYGREAQEGWSECLDLLVLE